MPTIDTARSADQKRDSRRRGSQRTSASRIALVALVLFQGMSGLVGGIGLVADPTGGSLHIPIIWLEGSLISDYLIPGVFLLMVLGIGALAVAGALWFRVRFAWLAAFAVGVMLLVWLGVEILVIGYQTNPPFQAIYGFVGLSILALALLPSIRKEYRP